MKYRILFLSVFLFGSLCAKAQTTPPPRTASTPQPRAGSPNEARAAIANAREVDEAFDRLRMLEITQSETSPAIDPLGEFTHKMYRKPSKKEMKVLTPDPDQLNKYALFLRQPDTGIIKLNGDSTCAENPKVVVAKENCLEYSMPGAGTAYSFRVESYRIQRLADLTLSKNVLKNDGTLQYGIMVRLGDIPLEEVTLQTKGLKYLVDFEPILDAESLEKFDRQLLEGIKSDGFIYGMGFYAKDQTTYALRSIAYKGKVIRSFNGIKYNEMDYDKRKDIIVTFRIIDQEPNGSITVLWKMLSSKDSPTLKIKPKKDSK